MKRLIAMAALVATATVGVAAAHSGGKHRDGKGNPSHKGRDARVNHARAEERVAQRLELNDMQRERFRAIKEREKSETKALRAEIKAKHAEYKELKKADDPRAERVKFEMESLMAQLKSRRQASHQEMLAVLTPEQRVKAEDMKRAMVEKRDRDRSEKREKRDLR